MMVDWTSIIIGVVSGGGVWAVLRAIVDKRKSPYDMLKELLITQKEYYEVRFAEFEREKLDSAEKSSVIMQSHFCKHKYTDPNVVCPVDVANDERLKKRCERCGYNQDIDPTPEPPRPPRGRERNEDYDNGEAF